MQKVVEQHDLLKKPKKYLISSYFGKEILINMKMTEFYLNLGLKITRIYEFIQFHPRLLQTTSIHCASDTLRNERKFSSWKQGVGQRRSFDETNLFSL